MSGDMIIVKEVLQHVPLWKGLSMLKNAKAAGIKWLAVTTNLHFINADAPEGSWFPGPDVEAPPFNFFAPAEACDGMDLKFFDLQSWTGKRSDVPANARGPVDAKKSAYYKQWLINCKMGDKIYKGDWDI